MTQEDKNNYLKRFQRFQQDRERKFAPLVNKALRQQYKTFTEAIRTAPLEAALSTITAAPITATLNHIYLDAGIIYGDYIRRDIKTLKRRMPIGFSERMAELIQQYFGYDILNTSEGISRTTRDLIRQVFVDSYEKGLGIDDLVKLLEGTELSRARARMITRTETTGAANAGAQIVAKESGLLLNKEWLSTADARTRRDHWQVNGQTVALDDYFNVAGYQMLVPGDKGGKDGRLKVPKEETINCRCTCIHIPIRERGKLVRGGQTLATAPLSLI